MITNTRLLAPLTCCVASKLNLRLSNLQLMPANIQIQYCYLLRVTNSIINPIVPTYQRLCSSSESNSGSNSIDVLAFDEGLNRLLCLGLGVSIDIESLISIVSGSANTTFFPARIIEYHPKGLNL